MGVEVTVSRRPEPGKHDPDPSQADDQQGWMAARPQIFIKNEQGICRQQQQAGDRKDIHAPSLFDFICHAESLIMEARPCP